ncbi:MAG: type II toxin-antitoxin system HicB family antitoxin [Spirochaetota bacterium]|nr:type II toxin-antitoxin system HicB family antitoxin [Spirochaetota bacterium]
MNIKVLTAIIYKIVEENLYYAEYPEIGSMNQGKSIEEALDNLKHQTENYLSKDYPAAEITRPFITLFETDNKC